jgi:hypothetical protein
MLTRLNIVETFDDLLIETLLSESSRQIEPAGRSRQQRMPRSMTFCEDVIRGAVMCRLLKRMNAVTRSYRDSDVGRLVICDERIPTSQSAIVDVDVGFQRL